MKEKEKKKKKSKSRRDYSSDETSSESESSQSSSEASRRRRRSEKNGRHGDRDRDKPSEKVRVPFEVDKRTGKCTYHSDVRLKRKSSDGRWKSVLKECPKCKADAIKRAKAKSSRRRKGGGSDSESSSASSASEPIKKKSSSSRRGSEKVPQKSSSSRHRAGESSRGGGASHAPSRQTSRGSGHAPSSSSRRPGESSRGTKPPPKTSSSRHRPDPREFAESQATKKTLETHGTMRTFETGATRSTLKTGNHSERSERRPSSKPSRSSRELRRTSSREIGAVDFDPPTRQRSNGGTKHKSSGGGQFDESYQESDFALFQGNGGKQYNEEGMFGFFKEKISNQQIKSSTMIENNEEADKVVIRDTVPKAQDGSSYNIGDEGKRRDMIKDDDKSAAVKRIASLQSGDPAFIRRTTGNWTFAKVKNVSPDSILFIVDEKGASKDYKKKYWGSHVRAAVAGISHSGDARGGKSSGGGGATRFSVLNLHDD